MRSLSLVLTAILTLHVIDGRAQVRRSVWQVHLMGVTGSPEFGGGGIGLFRLANGRMSYGLTVTPGIAGGEFALRTEGILRFSLDPARRAGVAPYGGGGLVWRLADGRSSGFLLILLGIESAPGTAAGWFLELGVGAGLRGVAGWRIRR